MICAQCGTENSPGDKFCEQCGSPLGTPAPATPVDGAAATMVEAPPDEAMLIRSDDPTQKYPLGSRVVVGRLDTCDIPIHDKSVSREHARLSQLPGGYAVEDMGSTNGTLVNGNRITEATILRAGDTITFGSVEFRFDQERAAAASEMLGSASTQPFQYRPVPVSEPEPRPYPAPVHEPEPQPYPVPVHEPESEPEPVPVQELSNEQAETSAPPAFDFPPLQPFTPVGEPVIGAPPPSPLPAQETPPPAEALPTPVSSESEPFDASPLPSVSPLPPTPVWTPTPEPEGHVAVGHVAMPEIQEVQSPPQIAEEPPVPPVEQEQPAARAEQEPEPVPQPSPAATPVFVGAASSSSEEGDLASEAVLAANHLSQLINSLATRLRDVESQHRDLQDSHQQLQSIASTGGAVQGALQDVPAQSMSPEQLAQTQDLLDRLIQDPRDIELLLEIGRHATDIAAVVNEYGQLRRIIDRAAAAVTTQ